MGDQSREPTKQSANKRIVLGMITNAHGVKGDVTIKPFGHDPNSLLEYGPLTD